MRGTYVALVLLVALSACTGGQAGDPSPQSPPATIRSLRIVNAHPGKVAFEWELGPGTATSIEVLRDGVPLGTLTGDDRRYVDKTVLPETRYTYSVRALADGARSKAEELQIRTPVPPKTEARLDGEYAVAFVVVESTLSGDQSSPPGRWRFKPVCGSGPCDAQLHSITGKYSMRLAFFPRNGKYEGVGIQKNGLTCNGVGEDAKIDLVVRVKAARVIAGSWMATRITGTFEQTDIERSNCLPALWRAEVRGRRSKD